jgi:hypothetical protein
LLASKPTPSRHGIAGVHRKVEHDLLHLAGVGSNEPEWLATDDLQLDFFANQAVEHLLHPRNHSAKIGGYRRAHTAAPEGKQLPGQQSGLLTGVDDAFRVVALGVGRVEPEQEQL